MSGRRRVAIPLTTLVVSFAVVLVGGWLGRPGSPSAATDAAKGAATSPVVHIRLEGLRGGDVLDPFPGLRITVSQPASPTTGSGRSADPSASTGTVEICISPG